LLGELMEEIHRASRRHDGGFSYAYNNGKWVELSIELSHFDGTRKEIILGKDTRITKEVVEAAIEAVKNI
jgi:hypothetical protein